MAGRLDQASQTAAIAKMAGTASLAPAIREELQSIVAGPAFASSHRSQRFLAYVVENALDGRFDQLKERTIGVELFGRSAAYDTNQDSIVRVTATDVRKRLAEHYAQAGKTQKLRIGLPQGSYIPEIETLPEPAPLSEAITPVPRAAAPGRPVRLIAACVVLAVLCAVLFWQNLSLRNPSTVAPSASKFLPWSVLFVKDRRTYLVTSDTAFAAMQDLIKLRIRLADYAARNYPPRGLILKPEIREAANLLLRNQFTASADAGIAASISQLAASLPGQFSVVSAKMMQIRNFRTADNFLLSGSSYANPWVELFSGRAGLSVEYDATYQKQICRDRRPAPGQRSEYVPTALTGGSGEAYSVITLLRNPGQSGWVLLLAGTSMEGTEAAADLALDPARLNPVLSRASIDPASQREFEVLLRLSSMAGAASSVDVLIARPLP